MLNSTRLEPRSDAAQTIENDAQSAIAINAAVFARAGAAGIGRGGSRPGPARAVELRHPAVAHGVRIRSASATGSSRPFSRRPSVGHPTSRPCPRRFGTIAANWALGTRGRWESPARTRRAMMPPSWRTGNSSAAPLAGIVCMHRADLGRGRPGCGDVPADVAAGLDRPRLGTCVEVSIAGYPEIIPRQLAIPAELSILSGLAVGYPDPDFPANKLHVARGYREERGVPRQLIE